ncbi:hypothetical protein B0H11DRAFT_331552 [Mycena galericulata]|nr:hypothetical protein B0H11DRAFT_331552 [Mycena galericulata]
MPHRLAHPLTALRPGGPARAMCAGAGAALSPSHPPPPPKTTTRRLRPRLSAVPARPAKPTVPVDNAWTRSAPPRPTSDFRDALTCTSSNRPTRPIRAPCQDARWCRVVGIMLHSPPYPFQSRGYAEFCVREFVPRTACAATQGAISWIFRAWALTDREQSHTQS